MRQQGCQRELEIALGLSYSLIVSYMINLWMFMEINKFICNVFKWIGRIFSSLDEGIECGFDIVFNRWQKFYV